MKSGKKNQNRTSNFQIFVKHDSPRHRKNVVFQVGIVYRTIDPFEIP